MKHSNIVAMNWQKLVLLASACGVSLLAAACSSSSSSEPTEAVSEAITATASTVIGAWEAAGKPALTVTAARPLQRVRKQ